MNLDFGILWIEDTYSQQEEESLRRRVRETGFIARMETLPNSKGIEEHARLHGLYHCYDLILLDYRLQDENGDEIAPKVRALFPSTTILFYSGSVDENELRRKIADKQVEGVYCSARPRFIERTGTLIEQTARSLDRLSGMRGLAMRVVAECDELMKHAVLKMSGKDAEEIRRLADLDDDVFRFMDSMQELYRESTKGGISGRLATRAVDSAKLFKHFRRLTRVAIANRAEFGLEHGEVERVRELRARSSQYVAEVLNKRNMLGHVVEIMNDDGWTLQGDSEISASDFPEIRRVFASNIDALREMCEIISTAIHRGESSGVISAEEEKKAS